jgi:hypothetical protein
MKKITLFALLSLLSSCFDITEKIKQNRNQSGEYSLVIDFSRSWLKTKSAILLGSVGGINIPSEEKIKTKLAFFKKEASKIKGISNFNTLSDFDNYRITIGFSYQSLEDLNSVLNIFNKSDNLDQSNNLAYFKETDGRFERVANFPLPKNLAKHEDKKEDLQAANLTTIYTFEKEIVSVQNPNSKISKSKKTVFLKHNVWAVLKNNILLNNSITLKS